MSENHKSIAYKQAMAQQQCNDRNRLKPLEASEVPTKDGKTHAISVDSKKATDLESYLSVIQECGFEIVDVIAIQSDGYTRNLIILFK